MEKGHLNELIPVLETIFSDARNPLRAQQSEAYLKGRFPFFGLVTEQRRALQKYWVSELKTLESRADRWELIHALWEKKERELHYVAIDWLNSWPKKWIHAADGPGLERLISHNSWWDSVDSVASNYLGKWARMYPAEARETFEKWRYSDSIWLQRSCLIYQLKYKEEVDIPYLESLIAQLLPNNEFFIQKAIGWTLRQLSKFNPKEVERILETHPIKGLARREAEKYL